MANPAPFGQDRSTTMRVSSSFQAGLKRVLPRHCGGGPRACSLRAATRQRKGKEREFDLVATTGAGADNGGGDDTPAAGGELGICGLIDQLCAELRRDCVRQHVFRDLLALGGKMQDSLVHIGEARGSPGATEDGGSTQLQEQMQVVHTVIQRLLLVLQLLQTRGSPAAADTGSWRHRGRQRRGFAAQTAVPCNLTTSCASEYAVDLATSLVGKLEQLQSALDEPPESLDQIVAVLHRSIRPTAGEASLSTHSRRAQYEGPTAAQCTLPKAACATAVTRMEKIFEHPQDPHGGSPQGTSPKTSRASMHRQLVSPDMFYDGSRRHSFSLEASLGQSDSSSSLPGELVMMLGMQGAPAEGGEQPDIHEQHCPPPEEGDRERPPPEGAGFGRMIMYGALTAWPPPRSPQHDARKRRTLEWALQNAPASSSSSQLPLLAAPGNAPTAPTPLTPVPEGGAARRSQQAAMDRPPRVCKSGMPHIAKMWARTSPAREPVLSLAPTSFLPSHRSRQRRWPSPAQIAVA